MRSIVKILTPASSPDLVSLSDLKIELNVTDNVQDAQLSSWITQMSTLASSYCNVQLAAQSVRETFRHEVRGGYDGCVGSFYHHGLGHERREMLDFACAPVSEVSLVNVDGVVLPSDQYEFDDDRLFRLNSSGFPITWWFSKAIIVEYTSGFSLENVPADLKRAIFMMIRDARGTSARGDNTLKSRETVGVSKLEWWVPSAAGTVLPLEISGILDFYARRWDFMR